MFLYTVLFAFFPLVAPSKTFKRECLAFEPETYVKGATRTVLQFVPDGATLNFTDNDATCNRAKQIISTNLCRIALSVKTSKTSEITFEAWLPETWSSRFLATGNGGIDGCGSACYYKEIIKKI